MSARVRAAASALVLKKGRIQNLGPRFRGDERSNILLNQCRKIVFRPRLTTSSLTLAAALLFSATAALAQAPQVAPSEDLPNAPSAPLAPTVHQQAMAAAPIPKIELWRGAVLGMTLDQVKTLFPSGHAPVPIGGAKTAPAQDDGSLAQWQMSDQVYGRAGVATLFFRNGGLTSVTVDLLDIKPYATLGNLENAKELESAFSGYYGKPKLCLVSKAQGLDQVDCRWEGHGLRIGLSYQDFGGHSPYMAIAIRPVPPPPKAKAPFFGKRARKGSSTS
jgi:hypothetical protein